LLIGTVGWLALLEIAVLVYFALISFIVVFIMAEVIFFPEKASRRMQLMGEIQGQLGLLEPCLPNHDLDTNKEDIQ
tara:strand:- start:535 stop:762 length:228 start_codon:yes stop_codon:yes gene_type:complete